MPPRKGEEGFTLIELVIVLVILPLVMGAVAVVMLTSLENQQGIQNKLSDSSDATVSTAYYVRDVESATSVTTTSSPSDRTFVCGENGTGLASGKSSFLLGLQLAGGSSVSYYEWAPRASTWPPPAGYATELVRLFCSSDTVTSPVQVVMSQSINVASTAPGVACLSPLPTNTPAGVTCTPGTNWTPTYVVSNITLGITQGCPTPPGPPCHAYQYTELAAPVIGVPIPPASTSAGPLTLLGSGTDIYYFFSSGDNLCATGSILMNSGPASNGPAIGGFFQGSNSVISNTTSGCGSPAQSGTIAVYNCRGDHGTGGACPGNTVAQGISTTPTPPISTNPSISDPDQAFAQQNPVPPVAGPSRSCPMTGGTVTCTPGLYAGGLTISDNETVTFSPGDYQFGTAANCNCALNIGSNDKVYFEAGDYTFEGGFSVNGSFDTICGISTPGDPDCPSTGGVFFYVAGGTASLGGFTFGNTIKLGPPTTGPYAGKLLWQDGSDNNTVTLVGAAQSIVNGYNGVIYAPNAQIEVYGFGNEITTGNIVANSLLFSSSLNTTVVVN